MTPPLPQARAAAPAPGRAGAWFLLAGGVLGLLSALTLTIEKVELLADPGYVPSCNFNPVLSCGSVMVTWQASLFGFPNPVIGIVAFTVVVVTGVLAVARVALPRWYWAGLAGGLVLGAVFVHWLIFQSVYRIGALCPYCMVVWAVTIPLLATAAGVLAARSGGGVGRLVRDWRWPAVTLWFTAVLLVVLAEFWDYWSSLL